MDSQESHGRRRLLAAHHKDLIGEYPRGDAEGDDLSMMAMGRASSEAATSSNDSARGRQMKPYWKGKWGKWKSNRPHPQAEIVQEKTPTWTMNSERPLSKEEYCLVEHFSAGLQPQLTAHRRWLRSNREHWGHCRQRWCTNSRLQRSKSSVLDATICKGNSSPEPHHVIVFGGCRTGANKQCRQCSAVLEGEAREVIFASACIPRLPAGEETMDTISTRAGDDSVTTSRP